MSTLIISQSLSVQAAAGQFATVPSLAASVATTNANTISGSTTAGVSALTLYKGAVPTFESFTDRSSRAADALITFAIDGGIPTSLTAGAGASGGILGVVGNTFRVVYGKCFTPTSAAAAGLATWFLLYRTGTTTLADKGSMIGTVGAVGSDADLELDDPNITLAGKYVSSGFIVSFPMIFTVT